MSKELSGVSDTQATQQAADAYVRSAGSFSCGQLPSSSAGLSTSTWHATLRPPIPRPISVKRAVNAKRISEELDAMKETTTRLSARLAEDQASVSQADIDSPFADVVDVINRLLPYHIFQQSREDLEKFIATSWKGKGKAVEEDLADTKLALELHKRRSILYDRWLKLKARSGKREASDDQSYYLAQVVLDADRSENAWLANELRTARTEAERIEREKRTAANASRISHFPSTPQPVVPTIQTQYYRGYPYAYTHTQAYGATLHQPAVSTFPASPAVTSYAPYQPTAAIPVQLPVGSLPALHALGIVPVPVTSLPPEGHPQPAAVLRGSTANGSILSLEINVSLLQGAQMSGLAMVLNSLVTRGSTASVVTPNATANTQNTSTP